MTTLSPILEMTLEQYNAIKHTLSSTTLVKITDSVDTPLGISKTLLMGGSGGGSLDATFLTKTDETLTLPNSVPISDITLTNTESMVVTAENDNGFGNYVVKIDTNGFNVETPTDVSVKFSVDENGVKIFNSVDEANRFAIFSKLNTYISMDGAVLYLSNGTASLYSDTLDSSVSASPLLTGMKYQDREITVGLDGTKILGLSSGSGNPILMDVDGKIYKDVSSRRYKTDVRDLEIDSSKVYELRPVNFKFIETNKESFGFIAEEVDEILPELTLKNSDGSVEAVHYDRLSILLLAELKKLKLEVEALKKNYTDSM